MIVNCSLHIVDCDNTAIHDIFIYGNFDSPNNDGIDIQDSNNTLITRCHIDTGDDAICPKTYNRPLYNLTATDSWIRTKSSAIKLGSASSFDFVHLLFDNITIFESHRGLGLQIRDGGNLWNFFFLAIRNNPRHFSRAIDLGDWVMSVWFLLLFMPLDDECWATDQR